MLARALGLPLDAAAAIRQIREAVAAGRHRTIGLGLADDRYFTFSAGLGWDAEVVREVDRLRAQGRRESVSLFLRTMVHQYYAGTDRRRGPDRGARRRAAGQRSVHDHRHQPLAVDLPRRTARCCPFLIRISTPGSICWRCSGSG